MKPLDNSNKDYFYITRVYGSDMLGVGTKTEVGKIYLIQFEGTMDSLSIMYAFNREDVDSNNTTYCLMQPIFGMLYYVSGGSNPFFANQGHQIYEYDRTGEQTNKAVTITHVYELN